MQDILLNLVPGAFSPEVHLSQYDKGRVIPFKLVDDKSAYSVPEGAIVEVKATKPSGLGFVVNCTADGDRVTIEITETMSNEFGRFPAELSITAGDVLLGTANFVFNVERSPHPEGTTDGDSDSLIPELTLLVERIESSNARIESMTASATPLPSGQNPSAAYDPTTNNLDLGIPVADKQHITVDGVNYPITSITKTTKVNVTGVEVAYGEGQTLFIPDGYGMAGVEEFLQSQIDERVSDIKVNGVTQDKDASGVVNLTISDDTKADAIVKTASGEIASFTDGGDDLLMKSLRVNIVPKQSGSGDPSPSNVRPISGWDAVDAEKLGKNYNENLERVYIGKDGVPISDSTCVTTDYIPINEGETLIFRPRNSTLGYRVMTIAFYDSNKSIIGSRIDYTVSAKSVNTYKRVAPANAKYCRCTNQGAGESGPYILLAGVTSTITTNLGQTVYGGNADIVNGNGTDGMFFRELKGTENWADSSTLYTLDGYMFPYAVSLQPSAGLCSHAKFGTTNYGGDNIFAGTSSSSGKYIAFGKTKVSELFGASTLAEFKQYLANQYANGTPVQVAYWTKEPISELTTTPTEVKTSLGANNIWSESGTVEVEYRADTTLAYNELLSLIASLS